MYYNWPRLGYEVYYQKPGRDEAGPKKQQTEQASTLSSLHIACHKKFSIDFYASPEDLDKITEEDDLHDARGKRKAASKAGVQQRKILLEGSDGDSADDSKPDFATSK